MGLGGTMNKPGLFGRIDHKLVRPGEEKNELFEKYMRTGETLYCVPEYGQCGASVPLYRWFANSEVDSFITTHDRMEGDNDANIIPKGILCYIWNLHYRTGEEAPQVPQQLPSHDPQMDHSHPRGYLAMIQAREANHGFSNRNLSCPSLLAANGQWSYTTPSRTPGTVAFLNCNSGHAAFNFSTAVICQRTGRWLPEPPECRMAGCPPISQDAPPYDTSSQSTTPHGNIIYNSAIVADRLYPVGTTAMLVCGDKMDVDHEGADVSYCSASGWQPKNLGRCEKVCPLFLVERGQVVYSDPRGFDQVTNTNGTIATVICEPGTQLTGVGIAICVDGLWSIKEIGECKLLNCPKISLPPEDKLVYFDFKNQQIDPGPGPIVPGTTVKLTCPHRKRLRGAGESICHSSERWLPQLGTFSNKLEMKILILTVLVGVTLAWPWDKTTGSPSLAPEGLQTTAQEGLREEHHSTPGFGGHTDGPKVRVPRRGLVRGFFESTMSPKENNIDSSLPTMNYHQGSSQPPAKDYNIDSSLPTMNYRQGSSQSPAKDDVTVEPTMA
ncbi:hypothetical protein FO519_002251 [Halicephalobus sp. NKZ332]|nr:hypothetical protein FO519_002251 [Halicephalobus sp. NKZ332]